MRGRDGHRGTGQGGEAREDYRRKYRAVDVCIFFFQAEDGIRDYKVTGVQTCALPISKYTSTGAGGKQEVYFVSADMPARRLEGLPATASPEDVRQALLAAIAQRARWR